MTQPLAFEDVSVGDQWRSRHRTLTETDIVNFACMTGDFDPLHVDHEHAAESHFRRPIAHGLLGMAWVAGLGSHSPLVETLAFLGIENWEFRRPMYVGDTVYVVTDVLSKSESGRKNGCVRWHRTLCNQHDQIVQEGVFRTLVARRASATADRGRRASRTAKKRMVG